MEVNKLIEIVENLVKHDKLQSKKLLKIKESTGFKKDPSNAIHMLAQYIQNNQSIHEKLMNQIDKREMLNSFIELNLSKNNTTTRLNMNSGAHKENTNVQKNGIKKGPRRFR